MIFETGYKESRSMTGSDLAFVFAGEDLLVDNDSVPSVDEAESVLEEAGLVSSKDGFYFGTVGGKNCYAFLLPDGFKDKGCDGQSFVLLRRNIAELEENISAAAGYALHLLYWHSRSLFCGRCGTENSWYEKERAKICPVCANLQFPKISPAIIILIKKGDDILLAHNRRFPEGRYSLLAGFMEIGETIEETAAREVREEVGIEIENIRYVSSQSWPFPDSLMLGLTADYRSGDIVPDGTEIVHADWYNPENFPSLPGHGTIARKIIEIYTKTNKS